MKEGTRASGARGSRRLLGALVVSEIALALVLSVGAALMLRNLDRLNRADLGYESESLVTVTVPLETTRYREPQARIQFVRQAEENLKALPGVENVGATCIYPLRDGTFLASIEIEGRPLEPDQQFLVNHRLVTPGFLRTLGVPLLRGRLLSETDQETSPRVAVISRAFAQRYFPEQDPIGKRVRNLRGGRAAPWLTVVGVVSDVREFYDVQETWYLPYVQNADSNFANQAIFALRVAGTGASLERDLRGAIWAVDSMLPLFRLGSVRDRHAQTLSQQRSGTWLLGAFAALGLVMAAVGIYGVMSYAVSQRTQEIGIRMALGARPAQVLSWVFREGARSVALGIACGLAAALALSRFMSSVLTEVSPTDPYIFAGVSLLLAFVALAATWVPARRATTVDPMQALRHE